MGKQRSKKLPETVVQGWDVSLNHGAMVELTDGEMTDFSFVTSLAGDANASKRGIRMNLLKIEKETGKDRHRFAIIRLCQMRHHVRTWAEKRPHYIGLEDYALDASRGAHYLGEIGGLARVTAYDLGIPLRLHDPTSIKMFTTHDGTSPKEEMEISVLERWGVDFSDLNTGKSSEVSEDLNDAYAIAQMVWLEVQFRRGQVLMQGFHEKEIRVFNRITKAQPEALLNREWIIRDGVLNKGIG